MLLNDALYRVYMGLIWLLYYYLSVGQAIRFLDRSLPDAAVSEADAPK